jgi:uncharacterized protein with PIN domain
VRGELFKYRAATVSGENALSSKSVFAMSLNIRSEAAHRLAQGLAQLTGESMTAALMQAIRERFDRVRREQAVGPADWLAIEAVTEARARITREAYRDFGQGSGHPARLNFGDCFAYALARATSEPCCSRGAISRTPTSRLLGHDFRIR